MLGRLLEQRQPGRARGSPHRPAFTGPDAPQPGPSEHGALGTQPNHNGERTIALLSARASERRRHVAVLDLQPRAVESQRAPRRVPGRPEFAPRAERAAAVVDRDEAEEIDSSGDSREIFDETLRLEVTCLTAVMFPSFRLVPYSKKYAVGCPPVTICPCRVPPCLPIAVTAPVVAFGARAPAGATGAVTTVAAEAVAVAPSSFVADPVLVAVSAFDTAATIETVALAPLAIVPSEQVTFAGAPLAEQLPCDAVAPNSVELAGSWSTMVVAVDGAGPLLVVVSVYANAAPVTALAGADLVSASAAAANS